MQMSRIQVKVALMRDGLQKRGLSTSFFSLSSLQLGPHYVSQ